jgi:hypothetical protein
LDDESGRMVRRAGTVLKGRREKGEGRRGFDAEGRREKARRKKVEVEMALAGVNSVKGESENRFLTLKAKGGSQVDE